MLRMGSRSPLRSGLRRTEVHRTSCAPSSVILVCLNFYIDKHTPMGDLKRMRQRAGLNQSELARALCCSVEELVEKVE